MTKDEALKLALEAMKKAIYFIDDIHEFTGRASADRADELCNSLREAIAAEEALAQQEPVAWKRPIIYTPPHMEAQSKRPWVGLTDDEWSDLYEAHHDKYNLPKQRSPDGMDYERAIETLLKEKNHE
jgi:hypothetical protein